MKPKQQPRVFLKDKATGAVQHGRVRVEQDFTVIRVFIDNLLHAYVIKSKFNGLSSYMQDGIYYIEIVFDTKRLLLCHENRDLWEQILATLNEVI